MNLSHALAPCSAASLPLFSAGALRRAMLQSRSDDVAVATAGLDRVLRWDAPRALVEVQCATPWRAVAARLAQTAPALEACVAHGAMAGTVGRAVAANAPGPDGRPLVALIESVALVTPDGELQHASRVRNADLFALVVGGQDIFGVTYSVTLRVDALARAALAFRPGDRVAPSAGEPAATRRLELLVPPGRLEAFVDEARTLGEAWRASIERLDSQRTHPEGETVLRWAKQDYVALTLHLALPQPLGACVRAAQLCGALIDCAIAHEGSFAIASTREASRAQLETCYPELRRVLAEKARRDPLGRHGNAWYRHHRRLLDDTRVSVRWNSAQAASA